MVRTSKKNTSKEKSAVFKELHIIELNAKKVQGEGEAKEFIVDWKTSLESMTSDFFRISVECCISFDPPMFFELVAKYAVDYTHDGMTKTAIEKRIDDYASPCCGKNTLIIAELSQHMQGYPMIIAPFIEREGK